MAGYYLGLVQSRKSTDKTLPDHLQVAQFGLTTQPTYIYNIIKLKTMAVALTKEGSAQMKTY